jgi:hypothetical protein
MNKPIGQHHRRAWSSAWLQFVTTFAITFIYARQPDAQHRDLPRLSSSSPSASSSGSRQNKTAADYYTGGRSFSGGQNGIAIAGDYLSAASFLGITGAIALTGSTASSTRSASSSRGSSRCCSSPNSCATPAVHDGRRAVLPDAQRPVRMAAAISTLASRFFYLLAQMAGAGGLVSLLLGITGRTSGRTSSSPSSACS